MIVIAEIELRKAANMQSQPNYAQQTCIQNAGIRTRNELQ